MAAFAAATVVIRVVLPSFWSRDRVDEYSVTVEDASVLLLHVESNPDVLFAHSNAGRTLQMQVVALSETIEGRLQLSGEGRQIRMVDLKTPPVAIDVGMS